MTHPLSPSCYVHHFSYVTPAKDSSKDRMTSEK
nr:MAG TPA: hypothetical protein [Caudoviricetes sp.]